MFYNLSLTQQGIAILEVLPDHQRLLLSKCFLGYGASVYSSIMNTGIQGCGLSFHWSLIYGAIKVKGPMVVALMAKNGLCKASVWHGLELWHGRMS